MLGQVRSSTSEYDLKNFALFSHKFFMFFGGVLLSLALAFIPDHSYALQKITAPADNNSSFFTNIGQTGCLSREWQTSTGYTFTGGDAIRPRIYACGWRVVNGAVSYYGQTETQYIMRHNYYHTTDNGYQNSGYTYVPYDQDVRHMNNLLREIKFGFTNSNGSTDFITPILNNPQGDYTSGYISVVYNFQYNSHFGHTNAQPRFNGSLIVYDAENNDITDNDVSTMTFGELVIDQINRSVYMNCGDSLIGSNIFPAQIDSSNFGHYTCTLMFSIPFDSFSYIRFLDGFSFTTPNQNYQYMQENYDSLIPSYAFTGILGADIDNEYVGVADLYSRYETLQILIPENDDELDETFAFHTYTASTNNGLMQSPQNNEDSGNSPFFQWFNIFNFGFIFPFRFLFDNFSNSSSCVSIPIIGSMLHNSNACYSNWFSSSTKDILTPVISWFAMIILIGFIFSFLKGHSDPLPTPYASDNSKSTWSWGKDKGKLR